MSLLEPVPPKGLPFPKIPGPATSDRVCIVGAGPAGVHMALSLKRRGFTNLTIYEKSNRVGGKSFDINYRGVAQPMGTIFAESNYFDNLIPLAQEFGVGEIVRIPSPSAWTTNSASDAGSQLLTGEYVLATVAKLTNSSSPEVNLGFLLQTVVLYVRLHKEMFGDYPGDLMLQPSAEVMARVRGTFLDFLDRENMLALLPVFKFSHELQGYGYVNEISALYGLIWNNPKLIIVSALRALKRDTDELTVYVLRDGFEKVWKTIVDKENINIQFNTDIYSITRNKNYIDMKIWEYSNLKNIKCDFLIWTPEMNTFLRTVKNASQSELSLFRGLKPEIFTASLVNMRNRNGPYSAFTRNLDSNNIDGRVTAEFNMMGVLTPGVRTKRGLAKYNNNHSELKTLFVLQMAKNYSNEHLLNDILRKHFTKGFNATDLEILNTISWPYFPRWSPEEMEMGRHWQVNKPHALVFHLPRNHVTLFHVFMLQVLKLQGQQRMWYAGSSVSFESVRGVMEYNNLLLRQMLN